jgi:hypothetical protein
MNMKIKLALRRHHYMKRVSVFLMMVALVGGMMGCGSTSVPPTGAPLPCALNISSTAGGSVTVTVNGTETVIGPGETQVISDIPAGTQVDAVASPNEGYEFVDWVGGPIDGVTNPVTTINMQDNYEITANFEAIPPTYHLTMAVSPVGSGTATDETNAGPYTEGTLVNIKAVANEGYRFVNWTAPAGVLGNATEAETTFTTPAQNVTVTANFELIPATYELTTAVSPVGSGTATDETNASPYPGGTRVSIEATANQGYHFVNWTVPAGVFDNATEAETTFTMPAQNVTVTANFAVDPMVAAGQYHTVGLKSDGSVVALGLNTSEQCNVGSWQNIIQVAAGGYHTVGLKSDGTVVAVGENSYGQCSVGNWTDIIQVAVGYRHTVGLKSDGTVVAVGDNSYGQCSVGNWTDIIQVAAGYRYTVGLKSDGTAVAVGDNYFGQCDVSGWTNIVQVAAGGYHTVGLKSDGTAVAVGWNDFGQCGVTGWADIMQMAAGYYHTVGLRSDGTVIAVGLSNCGQCNVNGWAGIVQVAAGYYHTLGLKSDGTVVAVGLNTDGQCDVAAWNLN